MSHLTLWKEQQEDEHLLESQLDSQVLPKTVGTQIAENWTSEVSETRKQSLLSNNVII